SGQIQFTGGVFQLTNSALTVGSGGLLGSTLPLASGQRVDLASINNLTVAADGMLSLTGGSVTTGGSVVNNGLITAFDLASLIGGGTLLNNGLVSGTGRVSSTLNNSSSGEVRVGATDTMMFSGASNSNAGKITLLNGGLVQFTQSLTNANTGQISGRGT